jgi:hypothetical protein
MYESPMLGCEHGIISIMQNKPKNLPRSGSRKLELSWSSLEMLEIIRTMIGVFIKFWNAERELPG